MQSVPYYSKLIFRVLGIFLIAKIWYRRNLKLFSKFLIPKQSVAKISCNVVVNEVSHIGKFWENHDNALLKYSKKNKYESKTRSLLFKLWKSFYIDKIPFNKVSGTRGKSIVAVNENKRKQVKHVCQANVQNQSLHLLCGFLEL